MKRRVLVLGLTLLLAAVGASAVLLYVRQADSRALAGKRVVEVLVADKRVAVGTTAATALENGALRRERMPAETVPATAVGDVDADLAGLVATADIQPGQLLLRSMFAAAKPAEVGLPIPDGKLAVSIELGAPQRVAGHLTAGSMIAVFDTYTAVDDKSRVPSGAGLTKEAASTTVTRLLLPKVEVLAIGGPDSGQSAKKSSGGEQVLLTVAVTQAEAERLIQRANTGTLHLALITDGSGVAPGAGTDNRSVFEPAT